MEQVEIVVRERQVVSHGAVRRVLAPGTYTVSRAEAESYVAHSGGSIALVGAAQRGAESGAAGSDANQGDGSDSDSAPSHRLTKPGHASTKPGKFRRKG